MLENIGLYIPDVYQKDIYKIDYSKLKEDGIKLLTFDMDDTLRPLIQNAAIPLIGVHGVDKIIKHIEKLHSMGFIVALLSNSNKNTVKKMHKALKTDGFEADAHKPDIDGFKKVMKYFEVEPEQTAHIGNSIIDDVYGGSKAGVTTCLVRSKTGFFSGFNIMRANKVGETLEKKGIWYKHHIYESNDQYYQLGEKQKRP